MAKRKKIVMAFGAFDGVHTGHTHYLKEAKKLGSYLIVVIARDKAEWKFPKAYSLPENERKRLIESIGIADRVILGSTKDALEKIKKIKPDIIAITPYTYIDRKQFQTELMEKGISSKVKVINAYNHDYYDSVYGVSILKRRIGKKNRLMGIPLKGKS